MSYRKYIIIGLLLILSAGHVPLNARVYDARSDNKFYDYLMKKPLAVAMFYEQDKETRKNKAFRTKIDRLERIFSTIGKQGYYLKGGVTFTKANTKYDSICELVGSFSIPNLPAFMLFKNGVHLRNENDKAVMLVGWPTFEQLEDFIRDNLEKDIDRNIRRRARELQKLREAERWSYLWYRPCLSGWPYYGCGTGWGWGCGPCRPYWGVGFGFGNCCW